MYVHSYDDDYLSIPVPGCSGIYWQKDVCVWKRRKFNERQIPIDQFYICIIVSYLCIYLPTTKSNKYNLCFLPDELLIEWNDRRRNLLQCLSNIILYQQMISIYLYTYLSIYLSRVNKASAHQKNLDVGANIFIGNLDPEVRIKD